MKRLLLALLLTFGLTAGAFGAPQLSRAQLVALHQADVISQVYGLDHLLPAVLMVESSLCKVKHNPKVDSKAWGCGQLHITTVKHIIGITVTPQQIANNDALNMVLTAQVLQDCAKRFPLAPMLVLHCYHRGYPWTYAHLGTPEAGMDRYIRSVTYWYDVLIEVLVAEQEEKTSVT